MGPGRDFEFEDNVPAADGETAPAPVVVVEYRERGLSAALLPPALVLLAASLIVTGSRLFPPRPFDRIEPVPVAEAGVDLSARPAADLAESGPIVLRQVNRPPAEPDPEPAPTPEPERPAEPEGERVAAGGPLGFRPDDDLFAAALADPAPAPASEPGPEAAPAEADAEEAPAADPDVALAAEVPQAEPARPDGAQVWADIRAEAERVAAEARAMAGLKREAVQIERAEAARRAEAWAVDFARRAHAERLDFREQLKQILRNQADQAGPAIRDYCLTLRQPLPPPLEARVARDLDRYKTRLDLRGRVELMRAHGLPEPEVLFYLNYLEMKFLKARGGPRSHADAWVRAATKLLSIPCPLRPEHVRATEAGRLASDPG